MPVAASGLEATRDQTDRHRISTPSAELSVLPGNYLCSAAAGCANWDVGTETDRLRYFAHGLYQAKQRPNSVVCRIDSEDPPNG